MCTPSTHDAIKRTYAWFALQHIGYQQLRARDGSVAWLDMRNCSCGSTLSVLVTTRDAQQEQGARL